MTTTTSSMEFRILAGKSEERLLNSFFVLYKTARIMEDNNPTFQNQCQSFFDCLREFVDDGGPVIIKTVGDRYFVNEKLVRFDENGLSGASSVVQEWKTLGVGGVSFKSTIALDEVRKFFRFVSLIKPNSLNLDSLSASLKTHSMSEVEFLARVEVNADEPMIPEEVRRHFRKAARTTFFQATKVVEEVMVTTRDKKEIGIAKTKRVIHSLIDHITRDESSLIELTAIKDYDDYTYAHSTNVCVYALTMGVRLGLDRARLSHLGFAALFHDIGKVKLPTDLIRKPDAFDENDWRQIQQHPLLGAKTIFRNMKLDTHTVRAAQGALEHHVNNDFTGYPRLAHKDRPANLFSRIISIVDTFDALTSGRLYLKKSIPPDKVIKKMHYQMKVKFDPFLLKIFNGIVGIYPAGSLVLLSTDEIAVVLTNDQKNPGRPYVKVIGNRAGLLDSPEWVDLSRGDQDHRQVVRMIDPDHYGLDIKDFILGD